VELVTVELGLTLMVTLVMIVITLVNVALVVMKTNVPSVMMDTTYITDIVLLPALMVLIQMILPETVNIVTVPV
jgi:hypothetical protein